VTTASRRPLISGNWKMNLTHLDAIAVVQKLAFSLERTDYERVDVSIHPPFTALRSIQTMLDADDIPIALGAQDVHWEDHGAYTGEISPLMLAKLQVSYVIVGHSERRHYFSETDEMVKKKVAAVLRAGMTPIMCVGETLAEREAGATDAKVMGQLRLGLDGLNPEAVAGMVVAYEPIWAIGTGRTATPQDAEAVCGSVRVAVESDFGRSAASGLRIQYGGSVNSGTIAALMAQPDIDGALVGGASLDPVEFAQIVGFGRP
jgi:triosephosphate isomerase (TIM)